jgi:hypothetical protein
MRDMVDKENSNDNPSGPRSRRRSDVDGLRDHLGHPNYRYYHFSQDKDLEVAIKRWPLIEEAWRLFSMGTQGPRHRPAYRPSSPAK